jgi:hypothetical protein
MKTPDQPGVNALLVDKGSVPSVPANVNTLITERYVFVIIAKWNMTATIKESWPDCIKWLVMKNKGGK